MITRRRFLASLGTTAAGTLLVPAGQLIAGAPSAGRLRSLPHPLYREPIADPTAIPRFVQPLAVPAELGGEVIVVNGRSWPYLRVEPRPDRFRLLNGSDSARLRPVHHRGHQRGRPHRRHRHRRRAAGTPVPLRDPLVLSPGTSGSWR